MEHEKLAYHFVGDSLRDGRPVPANGVWLKHVEPVDMCKSGLHASLDPFDALQYAPGPILCKVAVKGIEARQPDKIVARQRCIIARFDATDLLYQFAREEALSVRHLWDAPEVVKEYLTTGNQKLRDAASAAAWDAARDAARDAASAAAWAAASAAARDAAWAAAWAAARAHFNQLVTTKFQDQRPRRPTTLTWLSAFRLDA